MNLLRKGCPECKGDLYIDYKRGKLWKCVMCSRIFQPGKRLTKVKTRKNE